MKLKNKQGFTLIELLAVIVVLAIIALIATPIVMKTIKNAKKGAAERSADSYIKQVETAVATERLEGNALEGEYAINSNGNICENKASDCGSSREIEIAVSGNKPKSGTIKIENGQVTLTSTMDIGGCDVTYDSENKKYVASEKGSTPAVEILCKAVTTATTGNVPTGSFNYGDEYTCELGDNDAKTFFVLETNGDNVSLIMNANVDSNGKAIVSSDATDKGLVAWSSDGNNHKDEDEAAQAVTAKAYLSSSTASWTKLNQSQITLPTASQVATASGKVFNNSDVSGLSQWLYDYLKNATHSVSEVSGYWTSTPFIVNTTHAWVVYCDSVTSSGSFGRTMVNISDGVRPVITISKSQLG